MLTHKLLAVLTLPALLALAACDTPAGVEQATHETGTTVLGAENGVDILAGDTQRSAGDESMQPAFQANEPGPGNEEPPLEPTDLERSLALEMVMYINDLRASQRLRGLAEDEGCAGVGFSHSVAMNLHGYEGELGPDDQTHTDRMKDAGVGYTITGALYFVGTYKPAMVFEKFMDSQSAKELMLHPEMVDIGVGVRYDPTAPQVFYYTVVFRHP